MRTKNLRYSINKDTGIIDGCGYLKVFPFEVDKNTPFQSIEESHFWKKENNEWIIYDPDWTQEKFSVRVSIPDNAILNNDMLLMLKDHVKGLEKEGSAVIEEIENKHVMYFLRLLPEHEYILSKDENVIIEYKK